MRDILFQTEDSVFSYRVAGICVQNGKALLSRLDEGVQHFVYREE